MSRKLVPYITAVILLLAGCEAKIRKPTQICPGKNSVAEALAALRSQSKHVVPLKANGQCRLEYQVEGKKKLQRESFDVKLLVSPPSEIYLQGDKGIVSKAIILGSNKQEFWLAIRPKEISSYWWGYWSEQDSSEGLIINPKTLLESFGIGDIESTQDWSLSNEGPYDVIAKKQDDMVVKKIYVYSCDYRVRRIEFFNKDGVSVADVELDRYEDVSDGFSVPSLIKVTAYDEESGEVSLSITLNLKSIKPTTIKEAQRNFFFKLPPQQGFKNVYMNVDGKWIKQNQ
jgi:hypothetical protein